ncbi:MAG: MgtC/SapB family protein [archaeon]|nr:MgtC/SapB family protein [archaeon]
MIDLSLLKDFLIALALGALIGLEREYDRYRTGKSDYAGIRTFPLIALFGSMAAYLGATVSVWIFVASVLIIGFLIAVTYVALERRSKTYRGATSEIAGFITFFIGALVFYDKVTISVSLAVIMTIILYMRAFLHTFAKRIKAIELADTLKFAVIAFVILPFLPDQNYGPFGIFNPYVVWLMVVFISGIGFAGYILLKWFGQKGIALTGILGGLISSTAVTMSFSQRSKHEKKIYRALVLGVILANGIMFIRILIEVLVINPELFPKMIIPLSSLALITAIFSYFLYKSSQKVKGKVDLGSPFTIGPALKFGALFAAIIAFVKIADVYFASRGVYLVSFISGIADVDAITVSLSQLAKTSISLETAKNGIIIAALTNVFVKGGIAMWFGDREFGKRVFGIFALLIVVGVVLVMLV